MSAWQAFIQGLLIVGGSLFISGIPLAVWCLIAYRRAQARNHGARP